jgi:alkaline phosphatase
MQVLGASPAVTTEPENGTVSAPAAVTSDASASGGKAVAFNAAATPPPAEVMHVAAVGDIQPASRSANSAATAKEAAKADFILGLGDYQYETGSMADFNAYFDKDWGFNVPKMYPVFGGNHDQAWMNMDPLKYLNGGGASGYKVPVTLKPQTGYSFNKGNWHFIVMPDACFVKPTGCDMPGINSWIDSDLKANTGKCTIAVAHQTYFTSTTNIHTPYTQLKPWVDQMYKYRVDMYLAGWNHIYERFNLQDGNGTATPDGVQAFIVGTGGKGLYTFSGSAAKNSAVRNDKTYGVLNLTLRDGSYDWKFQPVGSGTFTDSGTANCR